MAALSNLLLTYITGSPGATFGFAGRLTVGSEVLLGSGAPIGAAGECIVRISLIIHFLATQVATRKLQFGRRVFRRVHRLRNGWLSAWIGTPSSSSTRSRYSV